MRLCIISAQRFKNKHVSQDMVDGFEDVIEKKVSNVKRIYISEAVVKINRKINSILPTRFCLSDFRVIQDISRYKPDFVFYVAMGVNELLDVEPILKRITCHKAVYCIDTWQANYEKWFDTLKNCGADAVFLAYKASIPEFRKHIDKVYFLPQSMNEKWFYPREGIEKDHLFMQMGRKNKTLDEYVLKYLRERNLSDECYIREKKKGVVIRPSFEELAEEINKTYFFVLAPRSVDDENYTGKISDVTARFYEGMACKTMLIGIKPKDSFDELFPNPNAMIDINTYDEFEKNVDYYLAHLDEYERICSDNYEYLINNHTWKNRLDEVMQHLNEL